MCNRSLIALATLCMAVQTILSQAAPQATLQEMPVACNEEFARFLVDQQVSESRTVEETDKRIRILIRAADFIWKYDQPTARAYLTEAFKTAGDRFKEKGFEKRENKGLTTILPDYRFEVVKAIAIKDAEWAKQLIEQMLKEYEKEAAAREGFDKNRELDDILKIAVESLKTNPALSRTLFRRAMQLPLDFHWFWTVFSVAGTNKQFADELYLDLLMTYSDATPRRLLFLSAYPFASGRTLGIDKFQFGTSVPEGLTPNRNLQQRFIETFLRRAISYASDPANVNVAPEQYRLAEPVYITTTLNELEPIVIQDFPFLIQKLSEARAQATGLLNEKMRKDAENSEARNEELGWGFERRLKELEKAEAEGKLTDFMIVSLLTWGEKDKTEEQFKQIEPWLDKITEQPAREGAVNYFWFLRSKLAIKEARYADAEKHAQKVPEVEHRAILFFDIADKQLKNVNDAATVYSTLRDVGRLAEQAEDSTEKARVLLGLVNQYLKVNPVFAMQELADAIKVINRVEKPELLSSSTMRHIKGKTFSHFTSFSMPGYGLENTFKEISKNNFELSLSNAKALDDKYFRTLAVLAIAKNCVDIQPKKPVRKEPPRKSGGY